MIRVHWLWVLISCLCLLCGMIPAQAGTDAAAGVQGSSGAPAEGAPPKLTSAVVSCDQPSSPPVPDRGLISVSVNAATAWQPRGGEVLVAVKGNAAAFTGLYFKACFGWNSAQAKDYFSPANLKSMTSEGFVTVRPSDVTGIINLGVIVPPLDSAPTNLYDRWLSNVRSSGLGLVPVADMRLIGYTKDAVLFDEVRPVGVTNVPSALLVAAVALVVAIAILHRLARGTPTPADPAAHGTATAPDPRGRAGPLVRWLKGLVSSEWILTLVQVPDGRASLSAFQILLWTLVVAVSAMYVMVLSGNLINLTPGTLTLLGIAGAAGLIAAFSDAPANANKSGNDPTGATGPQGATGGATGGGTTVAAGAGTTPAGPTVATAAPAGATGAGPTGATGAAGAAAPGPAAGTTAAGTGAGPARMPGDPPQWRDLILDPDTGKPDIGRTQMLLFTVVSAAFVVVQVLNYYVIPDIPAGYQILIGISNGVYVGRKFAGKS
jgi:hypothetical protein